MSLDSDFNRFISFIPKEVLKLLEAISHQGFILNLVGGAVRDYLISKTFSKDLDFEIKSTTHLEGDAWIEELRELFKKIGLEYNLSFEEVGVGVFTFQMDGLDLEFSSPRKEDFIEELAGHKNFTATYVSDLEPLEAYSRRDFTINAMALNFNFSKDGQPCLTLIDPFMGQKDISDKVLRNLDSNFYKDPVRFLRMIRFKLKLDLTYSSQMLKNLSLFNLNELTIFYFKKEYSKSKNNNFFSEMYNLIDQYKIKVSEDINSLRFLSLPRIQYLIESFVVSEQMISFREDIDLDLKLRAALLLGLKAKVVKKYHKLFLQIKDESNKITLDIDSINLFEELDRLDFINYERLSFIDSLNEYKKIKGPSRKFNSKNDFEKYQSDLLLSLTRKKTPK